MKPLMSTLAVAAALALASPADAQGQKEQEKRIVSATGKVMEMRQVKTTAGDTHQLVKLQTQAGNVVVVNLGDAGGKPAKLKQGDRLFVSGRAARMNGKPMIFARYAGELEQVGRIGPAQRQAAAGGGAQASAGATPAAVQAKDAQQRQQQQADRPQQRAAPDLGKWDPSRLYRNGWSAEEMLDVEVRSETGDAIGEVEDIIVGADGRIGQVVVEVGGIVEIGDQHIGVPWKNVKIGPDMAWIQVPLKEVENGTFSLFGQVPQGEDVAAAPNAWRVKELIGDYAALEDVARHGRVSDVIFSRQGRALGLVVNRTAGVWGAAGWYGYPYLGYYPGMMYRFPYASADVRALQPFYYVELAKKSELAGDGGRTAQKQAQAQQSGAAAGSSQR